MEKEPEIIRTSLRLPKRLYDEIAKISEEHGLTMHAEIIRILNEAVEIANYQPQGNAGVPDTVRDEGYLDLLEINELIKRANDILAVAERKAKASD